MTNILLQTITGNTRALSFESLNITVRDVKQTLWELDGIPPQYQHIVCNSKSLCDSYILGSGETLPPLRVHLRIYGGKGGFGSLLRGGNSRVGQKRTHNFDACRDLATGRRLRNVNNEQKLSDWYSQEKERELIRIGENYEKKQKRVHVFDEIGYQAEAERISDTIATAFKEGMEARKDQGDEDTETKITFTDRDGSITTTTTTTTRLWLPVYGEDENGEEEEEQVDKKLKSKKNRKQSKRKRADEDESESDEERKKSKKSKKEVKKKEKGKEKIQGEEGREQHRETYSKIVQTARLPPLPKWLAV